MQTLLVGLDAACPRVLDPLVEDGTVPTLARLLDEGEWGPLESQVPPWTASAWPSLYTGTNPGMHGVFDFLAFDGYDWSLVDASHVRRRTLWEYLGEAGYTSVVVNAPVTGPPRSFDGALVPGYLAPEDPACHPEGLLNDLRDELGAYRVYARRETDDRRDDEAKFEDYLDLTHSRGAATRYLAERFDPDFGFVQFQKTDAVFHDFPGDEEKVRAVYEAVDQEVGAILDSFDPDTVVVASDHGIGPYDGYEFRPNERLRAEGLVTTTRGGAGVPSWFQLKDEELVDGGGGSGSESVLTQVATLAGRLGLTHQRAKAVLERLGLAGVVGRYVPVSAVFAASERVDHAESRAYLRSPSELGLRLNIAGRDPEGVVPADEYESARDDLIERLLAVETPDGSAVFEAVVPREKHVHGPYADEAVDVFCVPAGFEHSLSALIGDEWADPEPYNHKPEGMIAVAGDATADVTDTHLFDVAPTVLAAMGVPPDVEMDGVSRVDGPEPTRYPDFDPGVRRKAGDTAVEERLADLGYLE